MEIRWLALPYWQQDGLLRVRKIGGEANPANLLTKFANAAAHNTGIELGRLDS